MTDTTLAQFERLFAGNPNHYGGWDGRCIREAVTQRHFEHHLTYGPYIGIYPAWRDMCSWGCVDIDGTKGNPEWEELWPIAHALAAALDYKGATPWIERTANGLHVWVFPPQPVSAVTMRHALLAACAAVEYKPKEVNPKQERLGLGEVGNYVRLPYYGYLVDGMPDDRIVWHDGDYLDLEDFCQLAVEALTPLSSLTAMADLYTPPTNSVAGTNRADLTPGNMENLFPLLPNLAAVMWRDGHLGTDRSAALVKMTVLLRDDGWMPAAAFKVIEAYDRKLGKFVGRNDRDEQLIKILEMVYDGA